VTTSVSTTSLTNYAAPSQLTTNSMTSSMNWTSFLGLSSASGPNGDTFSIGYAGGSERPTSTTSPYGAVTHYSYVDNPFPKSQTATTCPSGWSGSTCLGDTHWVKTTYDGWGRVIETDTGYNSTTVSTVLTQYAPCGCSPLGKVSSVSQPYAPGNPIYYTTYNYDVQGRTTSTVAPDGSSTTTYNYTGNTVQVTDPAGKYKIFTMDAFGNLTQVSEQDPSLGTVTTTYSYDILNHLIGVSMPRGSTTQTRTFNYTNSSNVVGALLLSATNPENGRVTYTYNPTTMTLATKTDNKGQVFNYSYDSLNRLTQVSVGGTLLRSYFYDMNPDNQSYSLNAIGRLTEIKYPAIGFVDDNGNSASTQFADMFSYTQPGQVVGQAGSR
jgi:YD repeat-containing protein